MRAMRIYATGDIRKNHYGFHRHDRSLLRDLEQIDFRNNVQHSFQHAFHIVPVLFLQAFHKFSR
ncbi:MAG: hypothetical protein WC453_05065 [Patescibacteria group bacterium]